MRTVLEYLENTASRFPDKMAYADETREISFSETEERSRRIGSFLLSSLGRGGGESRRPVAVFMDKSVDAILAFLGILQAGCFYCPLDTEMPEARLLTILRELSPAAVLLKEKDRERFQKLLDSAGPDGAPGSFPCYSYEEASQCAINHGLLAGARAKAREADPLYVLFTSGSTGVPKGVVVSHRVILRNMEWLGQHYDFKETDVLGNQAPLYFDVSAHDVYAPLKFGAGMRIIPSALFSFPVRLSEYLNEHRVTAVFWVPFALSMAFNMDAFRTCVPKYLRYVFFAGEVMPVKHLNYWRQYIPDAHYANMYGPTETYVCTYYDVDRTFAEDETLPIGFPVDYADALVLDDGGRLVEPGSDGSGELCLRGDTLALGYYRNPEKTAERFVWNPLCPGWPETIYRTGDIVRYNERGELLYLGREDAQIKHMGYRIELGEIEAAGNATDDVKECACTYDFARKRIILFYAGREMERRELMDALKHRIPRYMLPNKVVYLDALPRNQNGKVDRQALSKYPV